MSSASIPLPFARQKEIFAFDASGALLLDFHEGQRRVMESEARYIFMLAGTQGGKTSLGPWWLWQEICLTCIKPEYLDPYKGRYNEMPPEGWMETGGDFLAVASSYEMFQMKMLPEILKVFVDILGKGRYWAGTRVIELRNPITGEFGAETSRDTANMWGRIILRSARAGKGAKGGANVGVTSLESATAKAAWLDEVGNDDYTIATWDSVRARLSLARGRVLGTTTLYNHGWMKKEIYDRWRAGNPNIEVVQFDSIMNPNFPEEEYYEAKETMPDWKFKMRYRGQYDRPAGAIFSDFDDTTMVIPYQPVPAGDRVIVGVDPGGTNFASVYVAIQPGLGRVYVFEEHHEGGLVTVEHAANIKIRAKSNYRKVKVVGGTKSEGQFRKDMGTGGVHVYEPAIFNVEPGIDRIIRLMKMKRLYIANSCVELLTQIREYSREVDALGEPIEKTIQDKSKFHLVDALRYALSVVNVRSVLRAGDNVQEREEPSGVPRLTMHEQEQKRDKDGPAIRDIPEDDEGGIPYLA